MSEYFIFWFAFPDEQYFDSVLFVRKFSDNIDKTYLCRAIFLEFNKAMEML